MGDSPTFLEQLRRDGFVHDSQARLLPLTGGVSSEIYLVEDGLEQFVVKRALAKLKVKDDWFADVNRNISERNYLECVGQFLPQAVPQLKFANPEAGYFGMEYLGDGFTTWKSLLMSGTCEPSHAQLAGQVMGEIHRQTADRSEIRERFDTTANFHQLRTSPYLLTSGMRHPEWQSIFIREAARLEATRECLVHGDFSPKNILIRGGHLVLIDCEVAWYGDSAFDAAFLLNHLFLKALYHAPRDLNLLKLIDAFRYSYVQARPDAGPDWEARVAHLLVLLMLARVDGKSPVEYLDAPRQSFVVRFVREQLRHENQRLDELAHDWFALLDSLSLLVT